MNTPLTANNRKSKIVYLPQSKQVPLKKRLFFFLLILIFIYFVVLFARQYWRMYKMQQSLAAITERIEEVKQENEELQAEIERLHSPDYIEQIAREELGMARSGEILFYFRDRDNLSAEE